MGVVVGADATQPPVPAPRQIRRRMRGLRRAHHTGSLADVLTDAYIIVLIVAFYGWGAVSGVRRFLASPAGQQSDASVRYWIAVAAGIAAAGLVWQGLRAVGPLFVTPAAQTWVFSSPVDRRDLLLPRFSALILGAAATIGVFGLAAGFAGGADRAADLAWLTGAGLVLGATGAGLGVLAQAARRDPPWARLLGPGLVIGGFAVALTVIAAHACPPDIELCGGVALPRPSAPLAGATALVMVPVAVVATILAGRALARVDRASLTAGAGLASAATSAAVMLEPSILTSLVESRRWRSVGLVRGRPLPGGRPGRRWWSRRSQRFRVLVRADLRRRLRDRTALRVWAALALVMYAVAVALPAVEGSAHVILAYLAAGRLTGGLRAISRSAGLRRSLGGSNLELHLAHLVVPAIGTAVWYLATLPIIRPFGLIDVVLIIGLVLAAYRSATKPPLRYGGVAVDTPFGMISLDLIRQIFRGPEIVAVLVVVELLAR
jgi:hypothetical protein